MKSKKYLFLKIEMKKHNNLFYFFNNVKNVYYTQACLYDCKQSIATHLGSLFLKQAFKIKII